MPDLFTLLDFQAQRKSSFDEPDWLDADLAYPADIDNPIKNQPQVRIQPVPPEDGTYTVSLSATYRLTTTGFSTQARFSLDGGVNWEYFSRESKDSTDRQTMDYNFPINLVGGVPIDFVFQVKKEGTAGAETLEVFFMNLWVQRVK